MRRQQPAKRNRVSAPKELTVTIDRYSHDGRGIGHDNQGRVVMVDNALVGETVTAQITHAKRRLLQGKAVSWVNESELRQTPACEHFGQCGGCQLQHMPESEQIKVKQRAVEEHFHRNGFNALPWEPPLIGPEFAYRHRVRLHLNRAGEPGFKAKGDDRWVPIKQCSVMSPALAEGFSRFKTAPSEGLQQVELVADDEGQLGLAVLKGRAKAPEAWQAWLLEQGWVTDDYLTYRTLGPQVFARADQFTQVNRHQNHAMLGQAREWLALTKNDRVLDLFCGNGNVALSLADQVGSIVGLESSEGAIAAARRAAPSHAHFEVCDLFTEPLIPWLEKETDAPNVIVLDPPRAGAQFAVEQLKDAVSVKKILYIACDPTTLARDAEILKQSGWHLRKLGLIDMFPQTRHIESMALFEQ